MRLHLLDFQGDEDVILSCEERVNEDELVAQMAYVRTIRYRLGFPEYNLVPHAALQICATPRRKHMTRELQQLKEVLATRPHTLRNFTSSIIGYTPVTLGACLSRIQMNWIFLQSPDDDELFEHTCHPALQAKPFSEN